MTEGISYKKCTYNEEERKMREKDCRIYRIRQERIKKLAEEKTEENLWQTIIAFQEYPFKTMTGLPFYYKLKIGKNGEWNKELLIDRREKSKSLGMFIYPSEWNIDAPMWFPRPIATILKRPLS